MEVVDPIPIPTQSDSDCDLVTPQVENAIEIIDVEEESKSSTGGPARTRTAVSILEEEDKYVPSNSESHAWDHVHLKKSKPNILFCNYCPDDSQIWSYTKKNKSLTNSTRHMDTYHKVEKQRALKEREDAAAAAAESLKKRMRSEPQQKTLEQVSTYSRKIQKRKNVELVIDLCIRDLQPFKSVAHSGFRNILGRHDKRFKPTDPSGASMIIDEVYNVVFPKIKETISNWLEGDPKRFISSCGDLWKSDGNDDCYGVMIAWIDDDWKLDVLVAGCPEFDMVDHSGESHKIKLTSIFENLGIDFSRVIANTTDGDPKISRGMLDLFENTRDHECHHLRCSPHTLELVPKHCLLTQAHQHCNLLPFVLVQKMKSIVSFFHASPTHEKNYIKISQQNQLRDTKFVQSNDTRWTSTQNMMESVAFAEKALKIYDVNFPGKINLLSERQFLGARQMYWVCDPIADATTYSKQVDLPGCLSQLFIP
jgi:hypothetical protein